MENEEVPGAVGGASTDGVNESRRNNETLSVSKSDDSVLHGVGDATYLRSTGTSALKDDEDSNLVELSTRCVVYFDILVPASWGIGWPAARICQDISVYFVV